MPSAVISQMKPFMVALLAMASTLRAPEAVRTNRAQLRPTRIMKLKNSHAHW